MNKKLIIAVKVCVALWVSLASVALIGEGVTITTQAHVIKTLKANVATEKGKATRCAAQSAKWKQAALDESTAISDWLQNIFSGDQLDLSAATQDVSDAKAINC